MTFVIAKLRSKIAYFNKLAGKLVTGESPNSKLLVSNNKWLAREMDRVEGMFFTTECRHRESNRIGGHVVHTCTHNRLHGANCSIKGCPL